MHAPLEGWVQRDVAVDLFKKAGLDFEAAKKVAQTRAFKPMELKGVTFSTDFAIDAQKVVTHNIVSVLPGKTHPDEHIIYRSEEHTSELQSLMRISYAVFCLKKHNHKTNRTNSHITQQDIN